MEGESTYMIQQTNGGGAHLVAPQFSPQRVARKLWSGSLNVVRPQKASQPVQARLTQLG
jgi:hypothetical protein